MDCNTYNCTVMNGLEGMGWNEKKHWNIMIGMNGIIHNGMNGLYCMQYIGKHECIGMNVLEWNRLQQAGMSGLERMDTSCA